MTKAYEDTAEAVFDRALSIDGQEARAAYVEDACGGDEPLRQEVESLLAAHDQAESFLEDGLAGGAETVCAPVQEAAGSTIGRYKLLEQIGEGGFGVVYMAEQQEPFRRKVALKIIKLGMDTKQVIGRFEAERQALALMDHPNIAKVFDAGATEAGRPYFVMELVKGVPITQFCGSAGLGTPERLELFAQVCDAVQHAHQKGIIHRDIKPSNVLVALNDDRPVPKVIDFGIAKATVHRLTERTVFTEMKQLIGTPAYMSPEQATFNNLDIDTRTDVYSLGALLYELLTGTAPFDDRQLRGLAYDELCRIIREEVPPTPSKRLTTIAQSTRTGTHATRRANEPARVDAWLKGEVDWIVMKALEKDRRRRYDSPASLAADIQRYLRGEPVWAVRPSAAYRLKKFIARHRTFAASVAAVLMALIIGATAALVGLVRAEIASARLQEQFVANQKLLYRSDTAAAMQAWRDGRIDTVERLLRRHTAPTVGEDLRGFEWYYLWKHVQHIKDLPRFPHAKGPFNFVFSRDGTKIVCADGADLRVWDIHSGVPTSLPGHTGRILAIDRADHRDLIASGGNDGTIRLWDLEKGTHRVLDIGGLAAADDKRAVVDLKLSRDGSFLVMVFGSVSAIYLWDLDTDEARPPLPCPILKRPNFIRLSDDGRFLLATLGEEYQPFLWDLSNKSRPLSLAHISDGAYAMAISRDNVLAVGSTDGTITLWNLEDHSPLGHLKGHAMQATSLVFSPDGRLLASGSSDNVVHIWDLTSRKAIESLRGITDGAQSIRFSPSGEQLAALGGDGTITVWDAPSVHPDSPERKAVSGVFVRNEGNTILSLGMDGTIYFTDSRSSELLFTGSLFSTENEGASEELYPATVSSDGSLLAAGTSQGEIIFFDLRKKEVVKRFQAHDQEVWWPAMSTDGRMCVTASRDGSVRLWEVPSGKPLHNFIDIDNPFEGAAFSPDGNYVAAANFAGSVYVWEVARHREYIATPADYHGRLYRVVFSPDGKLLAACGEDSRIVLWDLADGVAAGLAREPEYLSGHTGRLLDLAFSADSRLLASAGVGSVLLWDLSDRELRASFFDHRRDVTCVAFSPDGNMLISGDSGGTVIVRNAATPDEVRARGW